MVTLLEAQSHAFVSIWTRMLFWCHRVKVLCVKGLTLGGGEGGGGEGGGDGGGGDKGGEGGGDGGCCDGQVVF